APGRRDRAGTRRLGGRERAGGTDRDRLRGRDRVALRHAHPVRLDTARLRLRDLAPADAPFILTLLNEPSFIRNIGDRGVRTLDAARAYIENGPVASYARHGFGLYLVELLASGAPIGICGILKRDALPDPDLGFAFLPAYWKQGYAFES